MSEEQQPPPPQQVEGTANVAGDNPGIAVGTNTGTINQQLQLPPPTAAPLAIPAPVGDFTGRAAELHDLTAALATGGTATITGLRGMGGIGKSQLAYRLAQELKPHYPKQVMIALRGSTADPLAPAAALQRIIQHFAPAAQLPDDLPSLTAIYQGCLADHGQPVLILADDAADAAQTRPLLPPSGCALIVTSRHSFTLPGMLTRNLDTLPPADAEALLLTICPRIGKHAPELARLCGYLPLALRVSASLLVADDTRDVARYLTQLEAARLHHLSDPDAPPDDPQASVAASFALSYDALPPAAQQTFAQVAVFVGSFDLPAAIAVVELTTKDTKDAKDTKDTESELHRLLQQLARAAGVPIDFKSDEEKAAIEQQMSLLVRRSLLGYDPATARYSQHDLLRDYGLARLPAPEARAARTRHARYYAALMDSAQDAYLAGKPLEALALFDQERQQTDAVWRWLLEPVADAAPPRRRARPVDP